MGFYQRKITIITVRKPAEENINEELQWFGHSLGLFGERDKDKSLFRTFLELLKAAKLRRPLTSDELARHLDLSRGTIIHHINKLIRSGLVIHEGNRYMLRVDNLTDLIDELEEDVKRTTSNLKKIAEKIDGKIGL
jgi:predicted transcriptional regulator